MIYCNWIIPVYCPISITMTFKLWAFLTFLVVQLLV